MKKLTCILLVAMFTMTSMLFAQISGEIGGEVSEYFTITNKTTQESQRVYVNKFTSEGSNKSSYDVDFCLGIYTGDQIEITYSALFYLSKPKVVWSYSWNNSFSGDLESGLTTNLSVSGVPYNGSVLMVTGNILNSKGETSESYNIRFKNVHKTKRFDSYYASYDKLLRITYNHYNEVSSCLTKNPYVVVNKVFPNSIPEVFSGYMNNNGVITFNTKGITGTFSVTVTVNNVTLVDPDKTYLY